METAPESAVDRGIPHGGNNGHEGGPGGATAGAQVAGLVESFWQLMHVQVALWQASLLQTAGKMFLAGALAVGALGLALLAALFLYAGVFHVLTDYLQVPTVWAFLIFAGVHGLAAGILLLVGLRILNRGKKAGVRP